MIRGGRRERGAPVESEFAFSGTEAFPDAVNFGSGLGERIGTAMREAFTKPPLARTGDDFTGSLRHPVYTRSRATNRLAAFDDCSGEDRGGRDGDHEENSGRDRGGRYSGAECPGA